MRDQISPYKRLHVFGLLGLIGLDQLTKWFANTYLDYFSEKPLFFGASLHLVHNPGAAWGIFAHQQWLLLGVAVAVLGVLWGMRHGLGGSVLGRWAVVCLAAGTIGNSIDRMTLGWVTDFFNIGIIPVFNVADVLINFGVFGLLIDSFYHSRHARG